MKQHTYNIHLAWTGNDGEGTKSYKSYRRDHTISVEGKPDISASSDPSFRGDHTRYNPEELLVAALSSCHMLWYLHLCAEAGVVVTGYVDQAHGEMEERRGGGQFTSVTLRPRVSVSSGEMLSTATELHEVAHHSCFIASSVNFPVSCAPTVTASATAEPSDGEHR